METAYSQSKALLRGNADFGRVVKVIRKGLDRNLLWSVFALLGVVAAGSLYPPLDDDPIYWVGLIVFLLPIGTAIAGAIRTRRRGQPPPPLLSVLFRLSAMFLTALTLVVFLNGRLDGSSVTEIHTKVAGKFMARGRFSMSYHLTVASWRRAGREEDLRVSRHVYDRAQRGDDISVQLRRGWFGLPWYGRIMMGPARSRRAGLFRWSIGLAGSPHEPSGQRQAGQLAARLRPGCAHDECGTRE